MSGQQFEGFGQRAGGGGRRPALVVVDINNGFTDPESPLVCDLDETVEAIRLSARTEGMLTDPVYEGKSMQGMIDLVKKGFFPKGSKVLYAHLGGVPAINGYSYLFRNG